MTRLSIVQLDARIATDPPHHHETFTGSLIGEIVDAGRDVIHANFERMNDAARRRCESE
jgi:hypothetical protein